MLKKKYSKEFNFIRIKDLQHLQIVSFTLDDVGVFIVYDDKDFSFFLNFLECINKEKIVVCVEKSILIEKYYKIFKIGSIDISKPKIKYNKELDHKLKKITSI